MFDDRLIEVIKRQTIRALRGVFDHEHMDSKMRGIDIDMEYPDKRANYPAIFVQFSVRYLKSTDIGQEFYGPTGERVILWDYTGNVTLNILALTSRERDRIAGSIINTFAFGSLRPETSEFFDIITADDNIAIFVDHTQLTPGGQTTSIGAPWDEVRPETIVYEDSYSFAISGHFASDFETGAPVTLKAIDVYARALYEDNTVGAETHVGYFDGSSSVEPGTWV